MNWDTNSLVAVEQTHILQPVGEILCNCGVDNAHMTPDELKADELLLAQRQQEADGDGRGTFEGTRG